MAKGDIHVEQKRGAWQVESEGYSSTSAREKIEQLASREQAWHVAVFYARTSAVDAFLYEDGRIKEEKRFREDDRSRRGGRRRR